MLKINRQSYNFLHERIYTSYFTTDQAKKLIRFLKEHYNLFEKLELDDIGNYYKIDATFNAEAFKGKYEDFDLINELNIMKIFNEDITVFTEQYNISEVRKGCYLINSEKLKTK